MQASSCTELAGVQKCPDMGRMAKGGGREGRKEAPLCLSVP